MTRGGGDAGGFTRDNPEDFDSEQLFIGWSSGRLFEALGDNALDLSFGQQDFQVGDGFLIWDGNFDTASDAAFWLAPRTAFRPAGIIRLNTEPIRGDAFYLRGDEDNDNAELFGANLEYMHEGYGTIGATFFRITDSDDEVFLRDDMNVFSIRAADVTIPAAPNLAFRGEYVRQWGGDAIDIDADAWYVEAGYSLADVLPWSPTLSYRFSFFSGDEDPTDGDNENFDPLFYGFSRGYGTWFQGEITGEYLLFNSNQLTHMVQLAAAPTDSLEVGALYFHFDLDEKQYFGTPVTDTDFADEVNLYANWTINENVFLSAVAAIAFPGDAAKQVFGDDEDYKLFETYLIVTF